MHSITGGSVTYMRRVKTGDYEHAEAKAEINFSIGQDEDIDGEMLLAMAGNLAHKQVFTLLQLKGGLPAITARQETVTSLTPAAPPAGDPPAEKKKPGRPPGTSNKVKLEPKNTPAPPLPAVDAHAASMSEEVPMDNAADSMDDLDIESAAPAEITDAELQATVHKHNEAVKNSPAIRKLIGQFVAPPGKLIQIPQDMRREFLEKLKEIKPLA